MTIIAELRLVSDGLPLVAALATTPTTTLDVEAAMAGDPNEPALFVWAAGGDLDAFAASLADQPTIADVTELDDLGERRLYRVDVASGAPLVVYRGMVGVGASRLDASASRDGLDLRLRFPGRDALAEFRERLVSAGVRVVVRRLYPERAGATNAHGLTGKQYETLVAAVDTGYFAVPREAKLGDVADVLGISRQAASERVRRAMARLAADAVEGDATRRDD